IVARALEGGQQLSVFMSTLVHYTNCWEMICGLQRPAERLPTLGIRLHVDAHGPDPSPSLPHQPKSRSLARPRRRVPLPHGQETGSSRLSNLENDIQALKEGFVDMVQGQHELMELVRDSAAMTDQRLQALERRFSNLEGTLVNLMRVALGVKEGEGENQEKEVLKGSDSEEEEE
ncbi:hypothetical protein F5878DRAFT_648162, partial [Lentinula raphanica]